VDHGEFSGSIPLDDSGWCVARASTDSGRYPVLDTYVYATTSPIYVTLAGRKRRSPEDARYFAAWIDRMTATHEHRLAWASAPTRCASRRVVQSG